jgi:hypothetical protein
MPPKRTPSATSRNIHNLATADAFRTNRARMGGHVHPAHDPYTITAPIDPHSDGEGWGAEDNLRGRPRGVPEYNDF